MAASSDSPGDERTETNREYERVFGFDALDWFNRHKDADLSHFVDINTWIAKPPEEQRFLILACQLFHGLLSHHEVGLNFLCRPLVVASLAANYGEDSSFVVSINGSPPKGTFVVLTGNGKLDRESRVFYSSGGEFAEIPADLYRGPGTSGPQHSVVIEFLKQWKAAQGGKR
jgi:hypothetical protein